MATLVIEMKTVSSKTLTRTTSNQKMKRMTTSKGTMEVAD